MRNLLANNNFTSGILNSWVSGALNSSIQDIRTLWETSSWRGRTVYVLVALATATAAIALIAYTIKRCCYPKQKNPPPPTQLPTQSASQYTAQPILEPKSYPPSIPQVSP